MAAQTWFIDSDLGVGGLTATDPGAESTTATGWTVAKIAASNYAWMSSGAKQLSSTFTATVVPDGTTNPDTGAAGNSGKFTTAADTGTYDAGTWTATLKVIAVTSGGDADGSMRACLWKLAGVSYTLIAGPTDGSVVTNLAVGVAQTTTVSFAGVASTTLTNEKLVLQLGWKITGVGGANTRDVVLRKGTGITLVTPNFTATAAASARPKQTVLSQAVMRSVTRCQKLTRRRSGLFVPAHWAERIVVA